MKKRTMPFLAVVSLLVSAHFSHADTLSIYFPPALEASTGITTSTGGSLAGFTVRAGIFTNTPSQLLANLAGQTSAANIRSTIHASFTQYGSFSMTDALLNDPDQALFTFEDPITLPLRGQDLYLLFYNDASFNNATEMGIFRMATRADVPGQGVGVFPTRDDGFGSRGSEFYFSDVDKLVGPESFLNLLVGQYNATAGNFTLGALAGGIGQITSNLTQTNATGAEASYQILANNGSDRYFATTNTSANDLTVTALPAGFSISTNTGILSVATNAAAGTYPIRLVASNSLTASVATNTLTWVLQAAGVNFTTTTNLISATAGVAIDGFTFIATGTGRTYAAAGNLRGLTFSTNTGELSGIPTSVGTNDVRIDVTADEGIGSTTFSLAVAAPTIAVPGGDLTGGQLVVTAGTARTSSVTKTTNFTNLTGSISPTTTGVSFDGTSLIIATNAQPLAKGTTNVTLTLTASRDVGGTAVSAQTTVPLRIVAPVPTNLRFVEVYTDSNTNGVYDAGEPFIDSAENGQFDPGIATNSLEVFVGEPYDLRLFTSASENCPLQDYEISGLPADIIRPTVDSRGDGRLLGTNNATGGPFEFPVSIVADTSRFYEGGGKLTSNVTLRLQNRNAPLFSSGTNRVLASVGRSLTIPLLASNSPFLYEATNLPPGLQIFGDKIVGTPTSPGPYSVQVFAYNTSRPGQTNNRGDWNTGVKPFVFFVAPARPPTTLAPTSPGTLAHGVAIALTDNRALLDAASNGVKVAAYGLPPGISLDAETGKIYGTPTSRGTFTATVFMQNGRGWIKKTVTLTVQ